MAVRLSVILSIDGDSRILRRCVSALNAQTFTNLEIIMSDHTYDGFGSALERKLHVADNRLTILRGLPSEPRWRQLRKAVETAEGEYIVFLDAGQWLEEDALATMVDCMDSFGVDLAEMRTVKCINGVAMKNDNPVPEGIPADVPVSGEQLRGFAMYIGSGSYISSSMTDKIYRRRLLLDAMRTDYDGHDSCSSILNIHYLRQARTMVFMSYAGVNINWPTESGLYCYSLLADAKAAWRLKSVCGQHEECIRTELSDALRRHVHGMIVDNGWTLEATRYFLEKELADPLWRQAGISVSADELVAGVDKRDRWLDLRNVLARLLH